MGNSNDFTVELIKLTGGERRLRLSVVSGFALEIPINPAIPVRRQKEHLVMVFNRLLSQGDLLSA